VKLLGPRRSVGRRNRGEEARESSRDRRGEHLHRESLDLSAIEAGRYNFVALPLRSRAATVRRCERFSGASKRRDASSRRSTFWAVALLSALLAAVTKPAVASRRYDQAKQAFTSFEMVNAGHWL
jgi:hypothetical protein